MANIKIGGIIMSYTIQLVFRHIPIGVEFQHKGTEYTKTNFSRGYYWKEGRKVHRVFKKHTLVTTSNEYFNV